MIVRSLNSALAGLSLALLSWEPRGACDPKEWVNHDHLWPTTASLLQEGTAGRHSVAPLCPQADTTSPGAEAHGQLCPGNPVCGGSARPASDLLLSCDPGEPRPHPLLH